MSFDITQYVEFNSKGRGSCPCCEREKGKTNQNLSLVPNTDGAYKCFRGCAPDDIREALGYRKDRQVPTALAQPTPTYTVSPQQVKKAMESLLNSEHALQWLNARGISEDMIKRHQLGVGRAQCGDASRLLPCICIPIPANTDGTAYHQKKRLAPWLPPDQRPKGYKDWSQKGIPAQCYFTWCPAEATETWLCEGEWDAIVLGQLLRHHNVAIAVASFTCGCGNVPHADELAKLPGTVTLWYDRNDAPLPNGDIPGDVGAQKVAKALGDRARIAQVPMPDGCDVKGWDVTNALQHGYDLDAFQTAAASATKSAAGDGKKSRLKSRLITNDELIARAPDYVEWLIPDILTIDELFILAGPPRGGKSLLAMCLAKAISNGENFLDRPTMQGSVLYVNLEDSEAKLKERQRAQGWGEGMPVYWIDQFKLSELPELIEIAEELPNLRLIVLDTLSRIRDNGGISENSSEMTFVLEPLQELAKQKGICILVVHHTKKIQVDEAANVDVFDSIRGNGAIRSTARGSLIIAAANDCYRLLVENGHGKHDLKVRQDLNTLQWQLLGKWSPVINFDQKEAIVDFMNRVGSADIHQIHDGTGIPKASLYTVLNRLCADGYLTKTGNRKSACYARAIQLIKQLDSLLDSQNSLPEGDKAPYLTKNIISLSDSVPIIEGSSDHATHTYHDRNSADDRKTPRCQVVRLGRAGVSDAGTESVSAIKQQPDSNLTVRLDAPFDVGDLVRYRGSNFLFKRLCGDKHLVVQSFNADGEHCQLTHSSWLVTQTIPVKDLKPVKR